jgi:hypothetical protein
MRGRTAAMAGTRPRLLPPPPTGAASSGSCAPARRSRWNIGEGEHCSNLFFFSACQVFDVMLPRGGVGVLGLEALGLRRMCSGLN